MQRPRIRKRRDGIVEIRRTARSGGSGSLAHGALRVALLLVGGALFFAASLAGYLLVAVLGVATGRILWNARPRRAMRAPAALRGVAGPRLRLVRAADDAA